MSRLIYIFLISMVPVIELRGAIPYASFIADPPVPFLLAAFVAVLGNIVPVPLILLSIHKLLELFGHTKLVGGFLNGLISRASKKAEKMGDVGFWALMVFVGIPLPGTGAWTGAIISAILDLPKRKAIPAIFLGLIMSASIMGIISYTLPDLFVAWFVK